MVGHWLKLTLMSGTLFAFGSCGRNVNPNSDQADLGRVGSSLESLSYDLAPILAEGTITNMQQLCGAYQRLYPRRKPLFQTYDERDVEHGVLQPYQLPKREYFWLSQWSTEDPPATPLFWCYFHIPKDVVEYLALDGSEHCSPSNDFGALAGSVSNRVERGNQPSYSAPN